ncbi:MAG: aminotransferase class I/II-fold pyridoxal phosphate-dependent enzyme [Butyricicoccaceae bacterium]
MNSNATLYDSLRKQAAEHAARFHMPGHKGRAAYTLENPFAIDYTEIPGTGNLYEGDEPILSAERDAARYYGAQDCLFLTGGSTQGVMTAIAAAVPEGGTLVIDRNCHRSATHAMALLDLTPQFVFPRPFADVPGRIDPQDIARTLERHPESAAVLVTSPNYYGVRQDIPAIAAVCHAHGVPLLVDAAHAAHFPAVGLPSPIQEGADLAAVSAHKTLPALGQSAMLISSGRIAWETLLETAPMFGSSSPSYLLLASIDLARAWLEQTGAELYTSCAQSVENLCTWIAQHTVFGVLRGEWLDPCRLTICTGGTDLDGFALAQALERAGIVCEMADARHAVLICTGMDTAEDFFRVKQALARIRAHAAPEDWRPAELPAPERVVSVRKAVFSPYRAVAPEQAVGEVCARAVTPYPPGVPVIYPGERICAEHIEFLRDQCYNTIDKVAIIVPAGAVCRTEGPKGAPAP